MTDNQKLNKILKYLRSNDRFPFQPDIICKNAGLSISKVEAFSMIRYLLRKGYVGATDGALPGYYIIFEGERFIKNGGFVWERRIKILKNTGDAIVKYIAIPTFIIVLMDRFNPPEEKQEQKTLQVKVELLTTGNTKNLCDSIQIIQPCIDSCIIQNK